MPTAAFRFGTEGNLSSSAATRHTTYLCRYAVTVCSFFHFFFLLFHQVFLTVARLYLTGSSMNGLGCRSSDADLCLVFKGNVSTYGSALSISPRWACVKYTVQPQTNISSWTLVLLFFCFRKNPTLFLSCLASESYSVHSVSKNNDFVNIKPFSIIFDPLLTLIHVLCCVFKIMYIILFDCFALHT